MENHAAQVRSGARPRLTGGCWLLAALVAIFIFLPVRCTPRLRSFPCAATGATRRPSHKTRKGAGSFDGKCSWSSPSAKGERRDETGQTLQGVFHGEWNPKEWTEDPLATEQRSRKAKLTDAKVTSPKASGSGPTEAFELFGDFDIEALFDDLDQEGRPSGLPSSGGALETSTPDDIDDFFDSLLADPVFQPKTTAMPSSAPARSEGVSPPVATARPVEAEGPKVTCAMPNGDQFSDASLRSKARMVDGQFCGNIVINLFAIAASGVLPAPCAWLHERGRVEAPRGGRVAAARDRPRCGGHAAEGV
eukprot:g15808.t1